VRAPIRGESRNNIGTTNPRIKGDSVIAPFLSGNDACARIGVPDLAKAVAFFRDVPGGGVPRSEREPLTSSVKSTPS